MRCAPPGTEAFSTGSVRVYSAFAFELADGLATGVVLTPNWRAMSFSRMRSEGLDPLAGDGLAQERVDGVLAGPGRFCRREVGGLFRAFFHRNPPRREIYFRIIYTMSRIFWPDAVRTGISLSGHRKNHPLFFFGDNATRQGPRGTRSSHHGPAGPIAGKIPFPAFQRGSGPRK